MVPEVRRASPKAPNGGFRRTRAGRGMVVCRLLGHRHRFRADGVVMRWECERGCGASGSKVYASPMIARRYSRVLNRRDLDELGRRAPWVATMPLRLWHSARKSAATGVEPS